MGTRHGKMVSSYLACRERKKQPGLLWRQGCVVLLNLYLSDGATGVEALAIC